MLPQNLPVIAVFARTSATDNTTRDEFYHLPKIKCAKARYTACGGKPDCMNPLGKCTRHILERFGLRQHCYNEFLLMSSSYANKLAVCNALGNIHKTPANIAFKQRSHSAPDRPYPCSIPLGCFSGKLPRVSGRRS